MSCTVFCVGGLRGLGQSTIMVGECEVAGECLRAMRKGRRHGEEAELRNRCEPFLCSESMVQAGYRVWRDCTNKKSKKAQEVSQTRCSKARLSRGASRRRYAGASSCDTIYDGSRQELRTRRFDRKGVWKGWKLEVARLRGS